MVTQSLESELFCYYQTARYEDGRLILSSVKVKNARNYIFNAP
jgi:hypothetical protein